MTKEALAVILDAAEKWLYELGDEIIPNAQRSERQELREEYDALTSALKEAGQIND